MNYLIILILCISSFDITSSLKLNNDYIQVNEPLISYLEIIVCEPSESHYNETDIRIVREVSEKYVSKKFNAELIIKAKNGWYSKRFYNSRKEILNLIQTFSILYPKGARPFKIIMHYYYDIEEYLAEKYLIEPESIIYNHTTNNITNFLMLYNGYLPKHFFKDNYKLEGTYHFIYIENDYLVDTYYCLIIQAYFNGGLSCKKPYIISLKHWLTNGGCYNNEIRDFWNNNNKLNLTHPNRVNLISPYLDFLFHKNMFPYRYVITYLTYNNKLFISDVEFYPWIKNRMEECKGVEYLPVFNKTASNKTRQIYQYYYQTPSNNSYPQRLLDSTISYFSNYTSKYGSLKNFNITFDSLINQVKNEYNERMIYPNIVSEHNKYFPAIPNSRLPYKLYRKDLIEHIRSILNDIYSLGYIDFSYKLGNEFVTKVSTTTLDFTKFVSTPIETTSLTSTTSEVSTSESTTTTEVSTSESTTSSFDIVMLTISILLFISTIVFIIIFFMYINIYNTCKTTNEDIGYRSIEIEDPISLHEGLRF